MRAMVVRAARAPIVPEERALPEPTRGEVRIRVRACGVCHSDQFVTEGLWPGLVLPRVPGHEVAGVIDAVGEGVTSLKCGDRVRVGWHGGHDGSCRACLQGKFIHCEAARITGITTGDIRSTAKLTVTGTTRIVEGEDRAFLSAATVG